MYDGQPSSLSDSVSQVCRRRRAPKGALRRTPAGCQPRIKLMYELLQTHDAVCPMAPVYGLRPSSGENLQQLLAPLLLRVSHPRRANVLFLRTHTETTSLSSG